MLRPLLIAILALAALAPAALAEPVLVVQGSGAELREDPTLPPDAMAVPPRGGVRACAAAGSVRAAASTGATVPRALARAERRGSITAQQHDGWLGIYRHAKTVAARMRSSRRAELRAVVAGAEALARRGGLSASRMPAVFLQLRRNTQFWPTRSFPRPPQPKRRPCTGGAGLGGARVTFGDDPVVFQWYPGRGLQLQPLANFGKANALWRACKPPEPGVAPGRQAAPCRPEELRALLDRMVELASQRGGFTAWEYFFAFGGGTPPWVSGLAQGTAIQALTRGAQLLGDRRYLDVARDALGAFEKRPPVGVRVRSATGRGTHYLIYSFSTGLRVLNGFLQSLVGLYDFAHATGDPRAQRLFATGDRAARREIPRYDTGAWSLYSAGGRESDLGYHRLVRDFLASLCDRTAARAYCARAARFDRYLHARTRVALRPVRRIQLGNEANIRFTLSKLSCVTVRVRRAARVVHAVVLVMPHGLRGLTYRPPRAGEYTVQVQAVDLLNHYTRVERRLVVERRRHR